MNQRASKKRRLWGGFSGDNFHSWLDKDVYGYYTRFAIYRTRAEARKQYADVRPIEIKEVPNGR